MISIYWNGASVLAGVRRNASEKRKKVSAESIPMKTSCPHGPAGSIPAKPIRSNRPSASSPPPTATTATSANQNWIETASITGESLRMTMALPANAAAAINGSIELQPNTSQLGRMTITAPTSPTATAT